VALTDHPETEVSRASTFETGRAMISPHVKDRSSFTNPLTWSWYVAVSISGIPPSLKTGGLSRDKILIIGSFQLSRNDKQAPTWRMLLYSFKKDTKIAARISRKRVERYASIQSQCGSS
jgi:hypothetical protein